MTWCTVKGGTFESIVQPMSVAVCSALGVLEAGSCSVGMAVKT